jgi:chemotaxis protein CheZ
MSATDDTPELEALFDSIVAETVAARCAETGETAPEATSTGSSSAPSNDVFSHVGQLTRQLHDTLRELGHDRVLTEVADKIPDARDRLSYISKLTEDAAEKVLAATERAQPLQDTIVDASAALSSRWDAVFAGESDPVAFKALAEDTRAFLNAAGNAANNTRSELLAIMMAQDFQDLTGQVIKKMTELTANLERELLSILIEHAPGEKGGEAGGLKGPAYNAKTMSESLGNQVEVDALLESLGF